VLELDLVDVWIGAGVQSRPRIRKGTSALIGKPGWSRVRRSGWCRPSASRKDLSENAADRLALEASMVGTPFV